jgi:amino acid transporter
MFLLPSCTGGELAIVAAGEARRPRTDVPAVVHFNYLVPIGFYILISFLVGFNINYLEPNLYHTWANILSNSSVSHSPIIIIVKYTSIHVLPNFLNGCFLFSAYTAA